MPKKENKPAPPKAASKDAAKSAPPKKGASKGVAKPPAKGAKPAGKAAGRKVAAGKVAGKTAAGKVAGKAAAAKPVKGKQVAGKTRPSKYEPLFHVRERNFSIGNEIPPRRDLSRMVRWPRYIRVAKQKKILMNRLKVPPALNHFSKTLDKNASEAVYKLLFKYRPEEPQAKRKRLLKVAVARAHGKVPEVLKRPLHVIQGANQVIKAIEAKKAKLVLIAHDVEPVELVVALPALCRKLDTPYVVIKSKSALGNVVRRKWTSCIAIPDVRKEDKAELANLAVIARETFNDNVEFRRQWGGGRLGTKSAAVIAKRQRLIAKELSQRQKA